MDTKQIIRLKKGLIEPTGDLLKLSHLDIARKLSDECKSLVTIGAVRYNIRLLRERGEPITTPARGRPTGRTHRDTSAVQLCSELLALTGWSAAALHEQLSGLVPALGLPSKRTFQSWLKEASVKKSKRSRPSEARRTLVELCTVRLHQIAIRFPNDTYRVVQLAFERHTEFVHAAIYELETGKGTCQRPLPKSQRIRAQICQEGPLKRVVLDPELWQGFYKETTNKLGLPVTRFEYFADFGLAPLSWSHGDLEVQLEEAGKELGESQCFDATGPLWTKVLGSLASILLDYNEACSSGVGALRERTRRGLKEARRKQGIFFLKPPFAERERYQLKDYYKGVDKPIQLQLRAISKPKKIYASRRTAGGSQATKYSEKR